MIWLVGGAGMLGQAVAARLEGEPFVSTDREVDITDERAVASFAAEHQPNAILNCAAYTAVDAAEEHEAEATRINGDGPAVLARTCPEATLVHVSTDYVFAGDGERPYREDDPVAPLNAYGRSKRVGEKAVLAHPRGIVVRTAWLFGEGGPNFVRSMRKLMGERARLTVVDDQRGRPTYAGDLAAALVALTGRAPGIYHYANAGECTWHGFALAIAEEARALGAQLKVETIDPVTSDAFPRPAKRPAYSVLDTTKVTEALGVSPPSWREGLRATLRAFDAA